VTNSTQPPTWVRAINTAFAVALAAFILANYWPMVKLFDLSRGDLQVQGEWIGRHAKRITAVTSAGVADRAGLKAGDVMEFDPGRDSDWVLASYRNMPEGFTATLPVRHADGTRSIFRLAPERVTYLPTLNDKLALVARLGGLTTLMLVGLILVWARPGLMTWSLLLVTASTAPAKIWSTYFLAYKAAHPGLDVGSVVIGSIMYLVVFVVPFAMSFPRDTLVRWSRWRRALGVAALLALMVCVSPGLYVQPFAQDVYPPRSFARLSAAIVLLNVVALFALALTYRGSDGQERARLKWAILGISAGLATGFIIVVLFILPFNLSSTLSGSAITPGHWVSALNTGVLLPLVWTYAVLRQRVVDVQFAVSRTLVYGAVTTLALAFLAAVHWVLGRLIEQSGLAIGLEGLAAIGLGLVLHRASHGITLLVDRVLFRKHHQAEERLRRVTAALPFASDERAIAEALVTEPVRNLDLASAALFYRDSPEGGLRRVLAYGWSESRAASLEADSLLVRYLQAEHDPLRLDDSQLLPVGFPEGAALPLLAIPIVNQHVLAAVVLYGAHVNHTLLDPDEIELLHALAKAAATSHSQVRIATLKHENEQQRERIAQLEASAIELRALVRDSLSSQSVVGEAGRTA
jgi:hypothetical protein